MIRYLTDVLGVKQVLLPQLGELQSIESTLEARPLKILFVYSESLSTEAQDLFYKMIAAMKLEKNQIELMSCRQKSLIDFEIEILSCQAVVFFTDESLEWKQLAQSKSVFCVQAFGPEYLLKHSQYKKQTWERLQKVMAAIEPFRS